MTIPKLPEKPTFTNPTHWPQQMNLNQDVMLKSTFDTWYAALEEWHRNVFEGAVEVKAYAQDGHWYCGTNDELRDLDTHTGLLIQLQPIQEESAEMKMINDLVEGFEGHFGKEFWQSPLGIKTFNFLARKEREK